MKKIISFFIIICLVSLGIVCISAAANYSLEIIQPQEDLNTNNRFYKAYPGIEYNVRVAAIGGLWPNKYELTTSPTGMTIDVNTGEISWLNPVISASPHSVAVRVTDSENSTDTHSWTITVTTSGFKFLDAVNGETVGDGGTGTLANPWKTLGDMYEGNDYNSKTADSYAYEFLYFRTGTYSTSDAYIEDSARMPLTGYDKPLVWIAYPNEKPILNVSGGYIVVYSGEANLYVEGFEITNMTNYKRTGWRVASSGNDVTFRNNDFHGITDSDGTNMACIFIERGGAGNRWAILGNSFYDVVSGMGIEAYKAEKVLVEDNVFHDFTNGSKTSHALGPKMSYRYWFIRDNLFYDNDGWSIWADGYTSSGATEYVDISFNLVNTSGYYAFQANYDDGDMGQVYVYRNTFRGPVGVRFAATGRGPFNFYNNVIINADGITCSSCSDSSVLTETDNLEGVEGDGIIDNNGNLTSAYSSYLGVMGYQLSGNPTIPPVVSPPADFQSD